MESGTILFARPLRSDGVYQEKDDIVEAWCLNGWVLYIYIYIFFFSNLFLISDATFFLMMRSKS